MIIKILFVVVLVLALLAIVAALRPDDFSVTRSAIMAAPAAGVFEQVNDLYKWQAWSPWAKLDPQAKTSYTGPAAGEGASFRWEGNRNVGVGTMTIVESRPAERVKFRLDFEKPFAGTNAAEFTFKPEGDKTVVTWSMYGKSNFMAKVVGLFVNCDKMVGEQFDKGLADLKTIAEAQK